MKKLLMMLLLGANGLAAEELTGKLVVPTTAGTKASYYSGNFQLLGRKGSVILTESKQISAQKLTQFRDQWVVIQAELQPATPANPQEQAPITMEPDGKASLQEHSASYRVLSVKAYKGPKFPLPKP